MDIEALFTQGPVVYLSTLLGFPEDQLRTVLYLLLSYPCAFALKFFPHNAPALKHVYGIALGLFFCVSCLGPFAWVHAFITSSITYALLKFAPLGMSHKIAFFFCMAYMSISHIYRMYNDWMGWTLDYTGSQMIVTLKLTSIAFNFWDGNRKDPETLTDEQRRRSIKKLPTLLEFYGFVYFFPTFLAGPPIEITDYLNYINYTMFQDSVLKGQVPSTLAPTLVKFGKGLLMVPPILLGNYFYPGYLLTPAFRAAPFWERVARVHLHALLSRFKYYFAWFLTEGSCIACGMGYNGYDEKTRSLKWNRFTNVIPLKIEFAQSCRDVSVNWNIGVSDWLRNYVYLRVTPPGTKPTFFSTLATYSMSAFWHGFYPGYYFFFVAVAFMQEIAKDCRRKIRPNFLNADGSAKPTKIVYDVFCAVTTLWWLSYCGLSFLYLGWNESKPLWDAFHWVPQGVLVLLFVVMRFAVPSPRSTTSAPRKTVPNKEL